MRYQMEMWGAINDYVVACGGDPAKGVHGNVARMDAVAQVETWVERECASRGGIREYRRPAVSVLVSEAAKVGTVVGLSDGLTAVMGSLLGDAPGFPGNLPDPKRVYVIKNVGTIDAGCPGWEDCGECDCNRPGECDGVVEETFDDHDPHPFDGGGA